MPNSSNLSSDGEMLETLAGQFRDLVRAMISGDTGLQMEPVVQYARAAVPGTDHASISITATGQQPQTIVQTDEIPVQLDAVQYRTGQGPCMDAMTQSDLVWSNDLASDKQWPEFAPRAVDTGVRSILSIRLFLSESQRGSLNLYADRPDAFNPEEAVPLAAIFASYASLTLINHLHQDQNMHLERALESNREIGVAIGILMAREQATQSQAFDRLLAASQNLNRRLHDIATEVTATGKVPSTPKTRRARSL